MNQSGSRCITGTMKLWLSPSQVEESPSKVSPRKEAFIMRDLRARQVQRGDLVAS